MKKIRLFLSILAFAMALGFTVSPKLVAASAGAVNGYEFIPASAQAPARCKDWGQVCDNLGGTPCTIAGASSTLRESPDVGQSPACGAELRKLP